MRAIRKYGNKKAEIFYLIIADTTETKWFSNSHKSDGSYITIDEKGLDQVLRGESPTPYQYKIQNLTFRF